MNRHYERILLIGQNPPAKSKGVYHCLDDLFSLIKLDLTPKYDLIIFNPSEDFFLEKDKNKISPEELHDRTGRIIQESDPKDIAARLAIRAFHTVILSSLTGTDVILFTSDNSQQRYPLKISIADNKLSDYQSIAPCSDNHPLLSLPWEEHCPLGKVRYITNCQRKIKHLLLAERYKLPQGEVTLDHHLYYDLNESFSCNITLACPFDNNLKHNIGIWGASQQGNGCFLIIPEPHEIKKTLDCILNIPHAARNSGSDDQQSPSDDSQTEDGPAAGSTPQQTSEAPEQIFTPSQSNHHAERVSTSKESPSSPPNSDDEIEINQSCPPTEDEIRKKTFQDTFILMAEESLKMAKPPKWKHLFNIRQMCVEAMLVFVIPVFLCGH